MDDVKIDLGNSVPFLYEKFLELIGRDRETAALKKWFIEMQGAAASES
jgi:hypothetical protein